VFEIIGSMSGGGGGSKKDSNINAVIEAYKDNPELII
jgi:dynein heavy chain